MRRREVPIALPVTGEEEWLALREPLLSGWLTQGPQVAEFERRFAARHGVRHALAVTSCTTGLHLALTALGVGPGDEVIVPAFTWVASANVVLYCGATPVFVDVCRDTYNLDPGQLAARLTARTRAVIAVHLFGRCAEVAAIRAVLPADVALVEDAACASGAGYQGRSAGALGEVAVFSFHPRKSITTGEGGMVTTDDDALAERMQRLRNHGASSSEEQRQRGPRPYLLPRFAELGFNYRMTDLQGALGLVQLGKLDRFIAERARWAAWYREQLADLSWLRLPQEPAHGRHGWQSFVTYVDPERAPLARDALMAALHARGIASRPGTHALHMLELYRERFGLGDDDFPAARDCHRHTLAIPLHNRMVAEDFAYVAGTLRELGRA